MMATMKYGLSFASSLGTDSASALEVTKAADNAGFDSVWGGEHVIFPSTIESKYPYTPDGKVPATKDTHIPDPLIWLAYVASSAPSLRLGTCILILPQRNPLVLAKEIATLDHLTNGRVELGIGVGWLKEEFEALGVPWERRGARNDEYVEALRTIWSGTDVEFHGEFVDFEPLTCTPRPKQERIPITVGGDTPVAVRRAGRLADGYFPGTTDVDELTQLIDGVATEAKKNDRDIADITINAIFVPSREAPETASRAEQLVEIGVDRLMVPGFIFMGDGGLDRLQAFGENVISPSAG